MPLQFPRFPRLRSRVWVRKRAAWYATRVVQSTDSVNAYIAGRPTLAGNPDAVDSGSSFRNIHYFAAAATLYGSEAKGGYQYSGKVYDAKFAHVEGYDTCVKCHDPHSLELKYDKCVDLSYRAQPTRQP